MSRYVAGPPDGEVAIPAAIQSVMQVGDEANPWWRNELGGLTFRIQPGRVNPCSAEFVSAGGTRFAKWSPHHAGLNPKYRGNDLAAEAERLAWASQWIDVPQVLEYRAEPDGELLVTAGIAARSAVSPFWRARPADAALAIGKGLRALHDALPVAQCPFSWSIAERIDHAGLTDTQIARELLATAPAEDDLVVCHGDACVPNLLIDNFGHVAGYVDLGRLGVASRWADLAVAAWSTEWNYGPGFTNLVYHGYGIKPENEKIAYYRRLWDET